MPVGSDPPSIVREGEILAGKYRVDRILSIGGMGVVLAAHHEQLDTRVAIKFLLPEVLRHPEAVARFAREARLAAKITSEHVARVQDVGTLESGVPYMVMELLEGEDLATRLQARGPLAVPEAVEFVLQASVAIAEAHSLGIVHRDLKPANLFCTRRADGRPSIKVLDFGISKVTHVSIDPVGSVTKTSAVMGSPLYMSPEQVQNCKDVDPRTDVWSLGVILFELVTGGVPFPGEALGEIAVKIATKPMPSPRALNQDVPMGLEGVIAACLEKDRALRLPSVAELATALAPFAPLRAKPLVERITGIFETAGIPRVSASPEPGTADGAEGVESVPPWSGTQRFGARRPRKTAGLVAVAVVLAGCALVGAGVIAVRHGSPSAEEASASPTVAPTPVRLVPTASEALDVGSLGQPGTPAPAKSVSSVMAGAQAKSSSVKAGPVAAGVALASPKAIPVASASAAPVPATSSSVEAAAGAAPKQDCDPPYTLDEEGQKHFKPECYR